MFKSWFKFHKDNVVVQCEVVEGHNHIFPRRFGLVYNKETGVLTVNRVHEVKIVGISKLTETDYIIKKSTTKKLGAAAAGGFMFGPGGAVVGALVAGNNDTKKVKEKYIEIIFTDENNLSHAVLINYSLNVYVSLFNIQQGVYKK